MKHTFLRKLIALVLALALVFAFTALAFAQGSTAASDGQQSESSDSDQDSSQDKQAVSQKTELYTIMGLIAMGAMYVGIREKNRRR